MPEQSLKMLQSLISVLSPKTERIDFRIGSDQTKILRIGSDHKRLFRIGSNEILADRIGSKNFFSDRIGSKTNLRIGSDQHENKSSADRNGLPVCILWFCVTERRLGRLKRILKKVFENNLFGRVLKGPPKLVLRKPMHFRRIFKWKLEISSKLTTSYWQTLHESFDRVSFSHK